jgi:hypothetical protein
LFFFLIRHMPSAGHESTQMSLKTTVPVTLCLLLFEEASSRSNR